MSSWVEFGDSHDLSLSNEMARISVQAIDYKVYRTITNKMIRTCSQSTPRIPAAMSS